MAAFGLYAGMELSPELLERLNAAARQGRVRDKALDLIAARPLSRKELTDKLTARPRDREKAAATAEEAAAAADWLEEMGYLDDADYARRVVEHYSARGCGPAKLRDELYRRGVPRDCWDDALEAQEPPGGGHRRPAAKKAPGRGPIRPQGAETGRRRSGPAGLPLGGHPGGAGALSGAFGIGPRNEAPERPGGRSGGAGIGQDRRYEPTAQPYPVAGRGERFRGAKPCAQGKQLVLKGCAGRRLDLILAAVQRPDGFGAARGSVGTVAPLKSAVTKRFNALRPRASPDNSPSTSWRPICPPKCVAKPCNTQSIPAVLRLFAAQIFAPIRTR